MKQLIYLLSLFLFLTSTSALNETKCYLSRASQYELNRNSSFISECSECLEDCRIGEFYFGGYDLECVNECSYKYACDYELLDLQKVYKSDECIFATKIIITAFSILLSCILSII